MPAKPSNWRLGIAARLQLVAACSALAVAILAFASLHFATVTKTAASRVYHDGFLAIESTARLQALLEQHRRIVESAPAEVDRKRLEASQRAMIERSSQLTALLNDLIRNRSEPVADGLELQLHDKVPQLISRAQEVLFFAYNFAQDKAIEAAGEYARFADQLQDSIRAYRRHRMTVADEAVSSLLNGAQSLILWVSCSAFIAFILIGPLGLTITRRVLVRLDRITQYMTRLAGHDVSADVPSRTDRDEVGDIARAVQVFKEDAVELLQRKAELEQVNLRLDVALNNMTHGLCMFDADRKLIICNARYASMYGLPEHLWKPGTAIEDILRHRISHRRQRGTLDEAMREMAELATTHSSSYTEELPDGRTIVISHQPMPEGGWVAVHEDVSDRRRTEARIAHLAHHDQLTNLPNRVFFREEMDRILQRMRQGEKFALLCLDLDGFKGVNDSLGHPVGDALLQAVGERLRSCIPGNCFVARLGGDEFAVIHPGLQRLEESGELARHVIDTLSKPYEINGQQIIVGASVGIAIAPIDGNDPDQLLKNADLAMYLAKGEGRGYYRFFMPEMDAKIQQRRTLELDLRNALNAGQIELHYQPVVSAASSKVVGFEALARWFHPERGAVPPSEFIPLAEETGLIISLGEWILRTACAEAARWPEHIRVSVNLSAVQIRNGNLVPTVVNALAAARLSADRLELEITESALLDDDARTLATLHRLRTLGVRIAMDDFGTGYSSLSYLRSFPFDRIKIDRSFIRDLSRGRDGAAIVSAIINLARSLNVGAVAEGVETIEQLKSLVAEGCDEIQGYYFSPPRPASAIPEVFAHCNERIKLAA